MAAGDASDVLVEIGASLADSNGIALSPEVATHVLTRLRTVLPYDGASILCFDPVRRAHSELAWVDAAPSAPADKHGADSWPRLHAGVRTLSAGLYTRDERYTGVLHLDLADPRQPDAGRLVSRLAPMLAAAVDRLRLHSQLAADVPARARGAVVRPDATVIELPGRESGELLVDGSPLVRAIVAAQLRDELPDRFRWRDSGGGWHTVAARPLHDGVVVTVDLGSLPFGLTSRELDVLTLIAGGFSNPQIAVMLVVSGKTVAKHVEHLLDKLGVASRAAAAAQAVRLGLIELATEVSGPPATGAAG